MCEFRNQVWNVSSLGRWKLSLAKFLFTKKLGIVKFVIEKHIEEGCPPLSADQLPPRVLKCRRRKRQNFQRIKFEFLALLQKKNKTFQIQTKFDSQNRPFSSSELKRFYKFRSQSYNNKSSWIEIAFLLVHFRNFI